MYQRVRYQLEPGDVIEAVTTVARIIGMDFSGKVNCFAPWSRSDKLDIDSRVARVRPQQYLLPGWPSGE